MSSEISSDIYSKIAIAMNFIKKCSKQRPDKSNIATILMLVYGLATDQTLYIVNNMENCGIISLKHYESGPPETQG